MVCVLLKFIANQDGFIGLTLSQLALLVATGILISSVVGFVFLNDWGREAELKNISTSFMSIVEGMDTRFFENTTSFVFPDEDFEYSVFLSSEYLTVESDGSWNSRLSLKTRFLSSVWPRDGSGGWTSGEELHDFLNLCASYASSGREDDPISKSCISDTKDYLNATFEDDEKKYALNSMRLDVFYPVYIEKVYIYYDSSGDGVWSSDEDTREGFILVYQK